MNLQQKILTFAIQQGVPQSKLTDFQNQALKIIIDSIPELINISRFKDGDKYLQAKMVIDKCAEVYEVKVSEILSASRKREHVIPRQMVSAILYKFRFTYKEIATVLSRDHSTIMFGVAAMNDLINAGFHSNEYMKILNAFNVIIAEDLGEVAHDCEF